MDSTQTTIIVTACTVSVVCLCTYIRKYLRSIPPPANTPLPPQMSQMPQASQYTSITQPIPQGIQNPLPSAPMYQPPQQYVVYIPPHQQGYSSYPQQIPYYPPLTPPPCRGPYQV